MTHEYVAALFKLISIIEAAGNEEDAGFDLNNYYDKMQEAREFANSVGQKFDKDGSDMWNDAGKIMMDRYLYY